MRRAFLFLALAIAVVASLFDTGNPTATAAERLHLDVRFDHVDSGIEARLVEAGFEIQLAVPEFGRWQGWQPRHRLEELRSVAGVVSVGTPLYATLSAGDVLTEGDELLNAASARNRFGVDGSGVRVAVISDGIIGLDEAIQADEAPRLQEAKPFGDGRIDRGEEGTAMIEIVHDLAPGAEISFGAVYTDLDHIAAVNYFAQRVDIIVDDVSFAYPANQLSDVSINTTRALRHPDWPIRLYVTAAGNWAESHWSGTWQAGPDGTQIGLSSPGAVHQFNQAGDAGLLFGAGNGFNVEQDDEVRLALFWNDPWGRSTNDYNLYLVSGIGEVLASSVITQGVGVGHDQPREHLTYTHTGEATVLFAVIQNHNNDASPVNFDLFVFQTGRRQLRLSHQSPEGSLLAQSDAADALTVGAVNAGRQVVAEYSSRGPTVNGIAKPEISAVDRVSVSPSTIFGPHFSGSSAAAPHVAGVAALLLEAHSALLAADGGSPLLERRLIRDILTDTAQDILPIGPDPSTGAGLVDANAALEHSSSRIAVIESIADRGPGTFRAAIESGASILLFANQSDQRTIVLDSELPRLPSGLTVDGAGWTLDASQFQVGLQLGDNTELWGLSVVGARDAGIVVVGSGSRLMNVTVDGNEIGIRVDGRDVQVDESTVIRGVSAGIEISPDASASISSSDIHSNQGPGVRILAGAGNVSIGPDTELPMLSKASEQPPSIAELKSAAPMPRSGLSHSVSGSVSIDGLPAMPGNRVDVYLDRRLAASVRVDHRASFRATVTGPGRELRFAVDGVPLSQRVAFEAGANTTLTLRAVSRHRLIAADKLGDHIAGANLIHNNLVGIETPAVEGDVHGQRFIWGNVMYRNRVNLASPLTAPTIEDVGWTASGLILSGRAAGAAIVHLYAGTDGQRRYAASTPVIDGQFEFEHLDVDREANEFSVIAHTADARAGAESDVHHVPEAGSIVSVTPDVGYIDGGETVEVCGTGIASNASAPRVWLGNAPARVLFWSTECVSVQTPRSQAGTADIALLVNGSRPVVAIDGFEYRTVRAVSLKPGRNFVTWTGSDTRVTTAFSSLAGATFRAYAWDAERQQWQIFSTDLPASLNTLRTLKHDQALWILLEGGELDWLQPAPE